MGHRLASALATALVIGGCTAAEDVSSPVERYDSAGTTVVLDRAQDRPLTWEFERLYSLGGAADGPESFYRIAPNTVATDAESNLYVLDGSSYRVVSFFPDGEHRLSVGAEGQGPGELRAPSSLSVSSDGTISVFDFGKGVLVRFGADGSLLPQVPFPDFPVPVGQRHFAELDTRTIVSTSRAVGDGREYVLKATTPVDTVLLGVLPVFEPGIIRTEECTVNLRQPPVFAPRFVWDARDDRIAYSDGASYNVVLLKGDSTRTHFGRDFPVRSASESDARTEVSAGATVIVGGRPRCTISPEDVLSGRGFAPEIPWIESVGLAPWGHIWVERKTVGPDVDGPIDVFSEAGEYIGTLASQISFPLAFLSGKRIAVAETDDQDVARLVVFAIKEEP